MSRWDTTLTSAALDTLVAVVRQAMPEVDEAQPVLIGEGISTLAYALSSSDGEWVLRVSQRHPEPTSLSRGVVAHPVAPAEAPIDVAARATIGNRRTIGQPVSGPHGTTAH